MKNTKKDILINKYNKVFIIKKLLKISILNFFIHNNNLSLKNKSIYIFISKLINNKKIKPNLCLITSRKKSINKIINISRLQIRKLARLGKLTNFKIN